MSEATPRRPLVGRTRRPAPAALIVGILFIVMIALSLWYLTRRVPLVIQGEVQSRTFDMAARIDGRVGQIVVARSQDVPQGAPLIRIDNPELIAKERQSEAALRVAEAELARVRAGFRAETIAVRKAEVERAEADLTLAQKTFERTQQLVVTHDSPQSQFDKDRAALTLAERTLDQARFAYNEAVAGFTREDLNIALAKVESAKADVETLKALVDQMVVVAPAASSGIPHPGRGRRVRLAGRAADLSHRSRRHVGSVRSARGPPARSQAGLEVRRAGTCARQSHCRAGGSRDCREGRIYRLARNKS